MNKQAVIYARTNMSIPVDHEGSLSHQILRCMKFAVKKGFSLVGIYQDEISGMTPMVVRPEGQELQQAIKTGQIQAVIIIRDDRLTRSIVDWVTIIEDCVQAGVKIYTLEGGEVTSRFKARGKQ